MWEFQLPRQTLSDLESSSFDRPASGLTTVGVLTPLHGRVGDGRVRLDADEFVIGRGETREQIDLKIADPNVSRRHARILRIADQFVLEDLNSSNGTFVDGIPVRWTLLHDGDKIQIGRNTFYFDRLIEFGDRGSPMAGSSKAQRPLAPPAVHPDPGGIMIVRFWGTRGSIPTPGARTRKYGGNTTCLEVRFNDTILIVDAGSGIRELSQCWAEQASGQPLHISLLLTHLHWDHIQGFPFFGMAYQAGNTIDVYGSSRPEGSTEQLLSDQMKGAYFPIPLAAMRAELNFYETQQEFGIGEIRIRTCALPHPGGSLGYRFTAGGQTFVFATDCEFDKAATNPEQLRQDHRARRQYDAGLTAWLENADLLVIDCQYTDEEYQSKSGWGHNSIATVVDLCEQVRPKMLGLFHHDPMSIDPMVSQRVEETAERLLQRGIQDTLVFAAREQLCLAVQSPKKPAKPL
jgi:phosphoribosyl 1,2-cyclic phosphodiesterase